MKNKWILITLFTFVAFRLFAFYRGGEITYKITGHYILEATVTTYIAISGTGNLDNRDSITIAWGDGVSSTLYRVNGPLVNGFPNGVGITADTKQNIYSGSHAYPGPPPNTNYYILAFYDVNRQAGITNMAGGNSVNVPFYVSDTVYMGSNDGTLPGGFDASPVFLNPPRYYGNLSDTFTFNCSAYDPDGDSLSYILIPPRQSQNDDVPDYIYPDAYCQQISFPNNFQINAQTGEITWATPCIEGFIQCAIDVREYRCGVFIGTVERDMQIIVPQDSNTPPRLSAVHDTAIQPGQLIEFNIFSFEASFSDTDSLQILGAAFLDSINPPVFTGTTGNPATGSFMWQPDASFSRPYSHLFTVVSTNNYKAIGPNGPAPYPIADMETFRVWVADPSAPCSIGSLNNIPPGDWQLNIFPNPPDAVLHIQTLQQVSNIRVSDLSGREVINTNTNCSDCDLPVSKLENGVYLLSIVADNLTVTHKFIKIE